MNHTANYQLSQWEKSDKVQMEDFNADNAKIDAAIKAEADARTAADAAINQTLSKKGNCRIKLSSYVGTGSATWETPNTIQLDGNPVACIIGCNTALAVLFRGTKGASYIAKTDGSTNIYFYDLGVIWSNGQVTLRQNNAQAMLDEKDKTYYVLAFYAMDA